MVSGHQFGVHTFFDKIQRNGKLNGVQGVQTVDQAIRRTLPLVPISANIAV